MTSTKLTMRRQVPHHPYRLMNLLLLFSILISTSFGLSTNRKVAVIGATGRLGREAVTKLLSQKIPVKCLVRSDPPAFLKEAEVVKGDVTNVDSLKVLLEGCTDCLALFGATRRSKFSDIWNSDAESEPSHAKQINYQGVKNIIAAAEETKTCKRIVRITGKGETPWSFFSILINMLGSMAKGWNYEGEQILRQSSSVDYTIIRPGIMKPEEEMKTTHDSGEDAKKVLALKDNGQDLKVSAVSYSTIADLCIECLAYPNAARSTLTAMNVPPGEGEESYAPLLAKVEPDNRPFPANLIEEHKLAVRTTVSTLAAVVSSIVGSILFKLFS